jgi:hypothetical protein
MLKVNIGPGAASAASYYLKNILMSGNTFRCQGTWWGSPGRNLLNITSSANSPFSIINCTVANNTLFGVGGLMSFFSSPQANLQNNIVYFNNIDPYLNGKGKLFISYCDRDNTGIGNLTLDPRSGNNITDNPQFVDAAAGDFRLRPASPCINAGDPNPIYNDADGSRNDMGAYGGPAGQDIGFKAPTVDDPATPDIREDVIGTY